MSRSRWFFATEEPETILTVLICSSTKEEMLIETNNLKGWGAHFIQKGAKNKWAGMRPYLQPPRRYNGQLEWKEHHVYYLNDQWYIIGPKP